MGKMWAVKSIRIDSIHWLIFKQRDLGDLVLHIAWYAPIADIRDR